MVAALPMDPQIRFGTTAIVYKDCRFFFFDQATMSGPVVIEKNDLPALITFLTREACKHRGIRPND